MRTSNIDDAINKCGGKNLNGDGGDPGLPYGCPAGCIGVHRFGFASAGAVLPGASETITSRPQKRCQLERLWCSADMADFFEITAFQIGSDNVLATAQAYPLYEWISNARTLPLRRLICETSEEVTLTVRNVDPAAAVGGRTFRAGCTAFMLPA